MKTLGNVTVHLNVQIQYTCLNMTWVEIIIVSSQKLEVIYSAYLECPDGQDWHFANYSIGSIVPDKFNQALLKYIANNVNKHCLLLCFFNTILLSTKLLTFFGK